MLLVTDTHTLPVKENKNIYILIIGSFKLQSYLKNELAVLLPNLYWLRRAVIESRDRRACDSNENVLLLGSITEIGDRILQELTHVTTTTVYRLIEPG
jgi:hypothetical protein